MSTNFIPDENDVVVDINNLVVGKWYTVYALRDDKIENRPIWKVAAEGILGIPWDSTGGLWFVTDKVDRGYVYDQNIDRIVKQRAIANGYKFVTKKTN